MPPYKDERRRNMYTAAAAGEYYISGFSPESTAILMDAPGRSSGLSAFQAYLPMPASGETQWCVVA
jgi:hypothetical protein